MRRRLDVEMVRRGVVESRHRARELVEQGVVVVQGAPAGKASRLVDESESIEVIERPRYVGRGGRKLQAALESFDLDVSGLRVIDVGSSTGGFTDCVLQHGAAEVVAIDVGRGQLHDRLRRDQRVSVVEGVSVRGLEPSAIGGPGDLVCADLSFISLRVVMVDLASLLVPGGRGVLLVKPQFEAGRAEADRGRGVIRDVEVRRRVLAEVIEACARSSLVARAVVRSPITGADGNVEYLLHVQRTDREPDQADRASVTSAPSVAELVASVEPDRSEGEV